MKQYLFLLFFCSIPLLCMKAQDSEDGFFYITEDMPLFEGIDPQYGFHAWVNDRLQNPEHLTGTVFVQFIIEKDGSLTNVQIVRSAGESLDREALKVIQTSPKWTPGMIKQQPVKVKYTLPVKFVLFDGGPAVTFNQWVRDHLQKDPSKRSGKVYVHFNIDTDGSLTDVKIGKGIDPELDTEAIRVVSSSPPKWKSLRKDGSLPKTSYIVVVPFGE